MYKIPDESINEENNVLTVGTYSYSIFSFVVSNRPPVITTLNKRSHDSQFIPNKESKPWKREKKKAKNKPRHPTND